MINSLNYTGSKKQIIIGLKLEAKDVIAQIKEHYIPKHETERLNISIEEINECDDYQELKEWITHLQAQLSWYEEKEFEESYNNINLPQDDYGDNYYQKV